MSNLKVGDKVFHKSNTGIIWIVERIDGNEAYCTTIISETLEHKKESFTLTSLEKSVEPRQFIVGKRIDRRY